MKIGSESEESGRLAEARERGVPWRKWGPYLSERQWGTVREDYSSDGNAWNYFPHDQARSRAYHWGEDGLAGVSDEGQRLCFAIALWNGRDPILKERLFGLTNAEGNHGEDVKEYYFYLDSTPTHSYMKWLYKYPQRAYPYVDLLEGNRRRSRLEPEFELLDTGIFDDDRYFDVVVEYAKAAPEDLLVRITATNRGPEKASLHLLPTLWFRNSWSWWSDPPKPSLREVELPRALDPKKSRRLIEAAHAQLGKRWLHVEGDTPLLFTENETDNRRLFGGENAGPHVKNAFDDYVVHGRTAAVNAAGEGTKAAALHRLEIAAGGSAVVRLRLTDEKPGQGRDAFAQFDAIFAKRAREADEFYGSITPAAATPDEARVMRQALAGMMWTKQFFFFDLHRWLGEHGIDPPGAPAASPGSQRNGEWGHMVNEHVISMPDKWEYPWYAAWDLAFHAIALSTVDVDFAKEQLDLMLHEAYLHPTGQIPAYEWNFGDVNPPVHPWATLFLYRMEQARRGEGDVAFLKRGFTKLLANFTWWVNRKDRFGKNLFEGGFLGLDNIGVFDRSAPLPTGGHLEQADGTAWMALFSQNMLEMAVEISAHDPTYADLGAKFVDHVLAIGQAMNRAGDGGMWDEEDGFYYDVLRLPDGRASRLRTRSMVGLLPICATTVIEPWQRERVPTLMSSLAERLRRRPDLANGLHPTGEAHRGYGDRGIIALVNPQRLRRILSRMLDEKEFLSPYGIRALSRAHGDEPYVFRVQGKEYSVGYVPGDSDSGMFGGNSNWRGPVWMPVNVLLIRALLNFHLFHGDNFKVECPTGSGREMNLFEVAREISNRLAGIFLRGEDGRRPVFGSSEKFQSDPHWRDHLLFYEYFHGDSGAGVGASHQTGWTGLVAPLIELFRSVNAEQALAGWQELGIRTHRRLDTPDPPDPPDSSGGQAMKAITVEPLKPGTARLEDVAEPGERDGSVLVEAIAVGVCGTDVEIVEGKYGWAPPGRSRLVLGHESLGRVIDPGLSDRFAVGDLVVGIVRRPDPVPCPNCAVGEWDMCRNGRYTERGIKQIDGFMSERWRVEPEYAMKIDKSLGILGVLLEPTTVVAKAWEQVVAVGRRAMWEPRVALVTGAGPIGLLAAMIGRQHGLEVHVLDRVESGPKPELVRALGATYHSGKIADLGFSPDIIVECTGVGSLIVDSMQKVGAGGIVCLTGVGSGGRTSGLAAADVAAEMVLSNKVVVGSVNANKRHWYRAGEALARADRAWLSRLLTRRVKPEQFEQALHREADDIKVVLEFSAA